MRILHHIATALFHHDRRIRRYIRRAPNHRDAAKDSTDRARVLILTRSRISDDLLLDIKDLAQSYSHPHLAHPPPSPQALAHPHLSHPPLIAHPPPSPQAIARPSLAHPPPSPQALAHPHLSHPPPSPQALPLVSAMLITKDRPELAERSLQSFLAQSYPNKELIIIDEGGTEFQEKMRSLGDLSKLGISYHRNETPCSLGELRNRAVGLARGEYVCQWDDDDIYHPDRIACQFAACLSQSAVACFLLRQTILGEAAKINTKIDTKINAKDPNKDAEPSTLRLAISSHRVWEGTIFTQKSALSSYPKMVRAEDSPVVNRLVKSNKIAVLDLPELYIYTIHGENTWSPHHMQEIWNSASINFDTQSKLSAKLKQLSRSYPYIKKLLRS